MNAKCHAALLILLAAGLILSLDAHAATSFTSNANATITTGFGVGKNSDLNFGNIVRPTAAGTVVIPAAAAAARTQTGGIQLVGGGTVSAAQFTVSKSGGGSSRFDVTLPAGALTVVNGGGQTMTVDTWTQNALTAPPWSSASPPFALYIGATLHLGAAQAAGTYTGVFTIIVNQH